MHSQVISLPIPKAMLIDDAVMRSLGVIKIFLDSIEAGRTNIEVTLDISDDADDVEILRTIQKI